MKGETMNTFLTILFIYLIIMIFSTIFLCRLSSKNKKIDQRIHELIVEKTENA